MIENIDLSELEPILIINGQRWLHETEEMFYKHCVKYRYDAIVLDNLFENPEKLLAIRYLRPKTILMGTTGTYRDKIDLLIETFKKANYIPDNVVFTMGENHFTSLLNEISKVKAIKLFKIYPMTFSDCPVFISEL